jgi:hypothetical protein
MKIGLTIDGTVLAATLDDTEVARDFAALLPLTLTAKDYAATEKIADLPRKLATAGAPAGVAAAAGDISYYAPWGNLALFYKSFGHSAGLVRLGQLDTPDAGIEVLRRPGDLRVTIGIDNE